MNTVQRQMYKAISAEPGLHLRDYVRRVPAGYGAAAKAARWLADAGLVVRTGRTVDVRYWLPHTFRTERSVSNTLYLFGELLPASYEQLKGELDSRPGPLKVDVSAVAFMDSAGLRLLLQRLKAGPITLVSPTDQIVQLLELCRVGELDGLTVERRPSRGNPRGHTTRGRRRAANALGGPRNTSAS
jgi:ABC-type transporter Mla MlaB component